MASESTPPTHATEFYFLRTAQHASTPGSTKFANLYIRHHGSGIDSIMLTPSPPKFLRFELSADGQQLATSWKHPGRAWGFVLGIDPEKRVGGWEEVQIVENQSDSGFEWVKDVDGREVLQHNSNAKDDSKEQDSGYGATWTGWLACEWSHGHPQLFWVTSALKSELPKFCVRVVIVREPVSGQPDSVNTDGQT